MISTLLLKEGYTCFGKGQRKGASPFAKLLNQMIINFSEAGEGKY